MYKNLIKLIENELFDQESNRYKRLKKWIKNIEEIREINDLEIIFQEVFTIKTIYVPCKQKYSILKKKDEYTIFFSNHLKDNEIRVILVFILAMILLCPFNVCNEQCYQEIVCSNKVLIIREHRLVMQFMLEFLMPQKSVRSFARSQSYEGIKTGEELENQLCMHYHVNLMIARKRLITLGLID